MTSGGGSATIHAHKKEHDDNHTIPKLHLLQAHPPRGDLPRAVERNAHLGSHSRTPVRRGAAAHSSRCSGLTPCRYPATIRTHKNETERTPTMTTTTIDALIALFALAMIVVPMLLIAVHDFCRFNPFKPTNKHKRFGVDSDYMKAVRGGSKALAEYHRRALAEGLERREW